MSCGFWLRVNNYWLPIEDVQSGVGYGFERARDGFSTVGGVAHSQESLRAVRSWSLSFGQRSGPETVAALTMAAQQDAGDVMLWDESAARENLLDPVTVGARSGYPMMLCDGMPVISLTSASGGSSPTLTQSVRLKSNLTINTTINLFPGGPIGLQAGSVDALVKVTIPPTPEGLVLSSASLQLHRNAGTGGTISARHCSNAWVESLGASVWSAVPAGTLAGAATAAEVTTIPLTGVGPFAGTDMSLRLSASSGTASFLGRDHDSLFPVLQLTYAVQSADRVIRQHLRAGDYWLTYWTNAAAGTQVGTLAADGATLPLITGPGLGLRRVSVDLSTATESMDRDWTITILDSTAYLLGGLMLTSLPVDHYLPGQKTPVRVTVDDPSLNLGSLYAGERGMGERAVTIREVG